MKTESNTIATVIDQHRLVRPSTRAELAERLKVGGSCEVAGYVAEMTSIMLRGWLGVGNFTVTPSENPGWVIYRPNIGSEPREL